MFKQDESGERSKKDTHEYVEAHEAFLGWEADDWFVDVHAFKMIILFI